MLEIAKKESKTLNTFLKYTSRLARAFSTIRASRARAAENMFRGNYQELAR